MRNRFEALLRVAAENQKQPWLTNETLGIADERRTLTLKESAVI